MKFNKNKKDVSGDVYSNDEYGHADGICKFHGSTGAECCRIRSVNGAIGSGRNLDDTQSAGDVGMTGVYQRK